MSEPKARLLVVDDNEDNRDLFARRLTRKGYEVDVAEDGFAALEAVSRATYDLVLLDVMMPGMSGLEVLARLRETHSKAELPILMATAKTESQDVVGALATGANDYVTKPIDFPVALARIESHLLVRRQMTEVQRPAPVLALDGTVEPGTILDERYEVLSVIGEGGFAVVFKAKQLSTGQVVALKLLRAHRMIALGLADVEQKRFEREMKLIGQLQHPHVVRLVDSGRIEVARSGACRLDVDDLSGPKTVAEIPPTRADESLDDEASRERTIAVPYLVMEYLDGRPLSAILRATGALPAAEAVDLLVPVLSAVGEAHRAGIVHRDLKPPNIMVMKGLNGALHPKVLDFGIAKLSDEETSGLTQDTGFVGTPEYMSPEQARGSREVTPKSDQYALAVILYECVTGRRPFESASFIELVHVISTGSFPPPSDIVETVPQALEAVILRAMHADPALRFRSLEAFGAALLPFASPEVVAQWGSAFQSPSSAPPPRRRIELQDVGKPRKVREDAETLASDSMEAEAYPATPLSGPTTDRTVSLLGPTTLVMRRRERRRRTVGAVVIASLFGLGAAILAFGRVPRAREVPANDAVHVGATGDVRVPAGNFRVDVRVTPESAALVLDGAPAGVGRLRESLPRDGAVHVLRVEAPGYVPQTFSFADVPPPRTIALDPLR